MKGMKATVTARAPEEEEEVRQVMKRRHSWQTNVWRKRWIAMLLIV